MGCGINPTKTNAISILDVNYNSNPVYNVKSFVWNFPQFNTSLSCNISPYFPYYTITLNTIVYINEVYLFYDMNLLGSGVSISV